MDKDTSQAPPKKKTDLYSGGKHIQVNTRWLNMEDFLSELGLSVPPQMLLNSQIQVGFSEVLQGWQILLWGQLLSLWLLTPPNPFLKEVV